MTFKNAMADLPFGGGKSVVAVPEIPHGDERTAMLERYADLVASLGGSYVTACDMNTTEADMDVVGERCPHVMGRSVAAGGSGTSAPDTAIGVFHGIRAGLAHAFGSDDPSGRTIVVEGAGAVGGPLCDLLADAGAKLVVSDIDPERARAVAERVGGRHRGSRRRRSTCRAICSRRARRERCSTPTRSRACDVGSWPAPRTTSWPRRWTPIAWRRPASSTRPTTW